MKEFLALSLSTENEKKFYNLRPGLDLINLFDTLMVFLKDFFKN